ncbi:hypothetical protein B0H13DRAFT_2360473 [Mycena leptocephala]|nr:hypothetical protein B0H13DRAFT_2360473 [Mycena leptocephala]
MAARQCRYITHFAYLHMTTLISRLFFPFHHKLTNSRVSSQCYGTSSLRNFTGNRHLSHVLVNTLGLPTRYRQLYHVKTDMRPNVRRVQGNGRGIIRHNICHPCCSFNSCLSLQAAESNMEAENIPRRWCHIGTRISKAADARIPPGFDAHGQDYTWIHANITAISHPLLPSLSEVPKSHPSSPLSDLPMDMEVELPLEEPKQHANNNKPGNKKRKREKAEIGVEITPQAVQADRPQLRRSARTHKPRK